MYSNYQEWSVFIIERFEAFCEQATLLFIYYSRLPVFSFLFEMVTCITKIGLTIPYGFILSPAYLFFISLTCWSIPKGLAEKISNLSLLKKPYVILVVSIQQRSQTWTLNNSVPTLYAYVCSWHKQIGIQTQKKKKSPLL